MTCPKCGTQVRDDVRFCPRCGTPLTGSIVSPQTQETPDEEKPAGDSPDVEKENDPQKRQKRLVAVISIVCAVAVIVIITVVLMFRG